MNYLTLRKSRISNKMPFVYKHKPTLQIITLLACTLMLINCTGVRKLPEGSFLYTGATLSISEALKGKKNLEQELESKLLPDVNATILGSRPRLWVYNLIDTLKKEKGIKYWLKTEVGKPPLLLRNVRTEQIRQSVENELYNKGYFQARATREIIKKKKTARVNYQVSIREPYRIDSVIYKQDLLALAKDSALFSSSLTRNNAIFSLTLLEEENQRIEELLRNRGYYFFNKDYLIYDADTTRGERKVSLYVGLKDNTPDKARRIYTIQDILVDPEYQRIAESSDTSWQKEFEGIRFIQGINRYNPELIARSVRFNKGEPYRRRDYEVSLRRLSALDVFQFITIRYQATSDSTLASTIKLTPYMPRSLRVQLQAVSKSNNFVGPTLSLLHKNRNVFGNAEQLEISLDGSIEYQLGAKQVGIENVSSFGLGLSTKLEFPRTISPFHFSRLQFVPETEIDAGVRLRRRVNLFQLNAVNLSFGYSWKERKTSRHQFFPVNLEFVQTTKTTSAFDSLLAANPFFAESFANQFIVGGGYNFVYQSLLDPQNRKLRHNFYFEGNASVSGNLLNVFQSAVQPTENNAPFTLFGAAYAQYVRLQTDFRHYWQTGKDQRLVSRLFTGVGYPYGNSSALPFVKQYAAGGVSSIRSFQARGLGPGSFNVDSLRASSSFQFDQTGDIKLEWNTEYRFPIFGYVKGAAFLDVGNVWLFRKDEDRPGAVFSFRDFTDELAVGTGLGLRLDTDFVVIRLDIGVPLRIPYRPEGQRWVIDEFNPLNRSYRRNNLVYNIAIGYPF